MANPDAYVDKDECTGCELCTQTAPDVFRMDSNNLAEVHNSHGAGQVVIQEAMDSCPVECIHWKS